MTDKYGANESHNIMEDLNSLKPERQKDAVKKVIAAMTIGRDVSKLFPQVVKCIATNDLELKKLVYLYIINYSRLRPVEALLAVNQFKKDSSATNPNPLLRALAVRTMGCLGVEQIMQFLCDPLKDALKDQDPYVRKTAALCVSKIYDINKNLVEDQFCFIDTLQKLIEDEGNSMVIANCIASLIEISVSKGEDMLKINWKKCKCLMNALFENNEWCQIYLLEGISKYNPSNNDEISEIIERIVPFVSHSNSGVVLTAIKILIKLLDLVQSPDTIRSVCKKITPSLVTLLSSEPEIIYVALKNINLLIQKRPIIFEKDIKMFFCNFTEPIYNKMEKLEILYKLVSMNNIDLVLNELVDYATEVDVQFVKRSVRLIGQCAIKLEKAAQRCVEKLVELVKTKVSFVLQEAIVALRDIFRRYPNMYEGAMQTVNENLQQLDDSDAKSALIWIIGEYSDRIDGAEVQLSRFLDNLKEEPSAVQMNVLTAAVKTYLKCRTEESFNILERVFLFCEKESDYPDLRDRGFMYWRLIVIDPNVASLIVLAEKPRISEDVSNIDGTLLDKLIDNLGTLASVYSKAPELFVKKGKKVNLGEDEEEEYEEQALNKEVPVKDRKNNDVEENITISNNDKEEDSVITNQNSVNLIDIGGDYNHDNINNISNIVRTSSQSIMDNSSANIIDILQGVSLIDEGPKITSAIIPKQVVLQDSQVGFVNKRNGLMIESSIQREVNNLYVSLQFSNNSGQNIGEFEMQFNTNYFGIACVPNSLSNLYVPIGQTVQARVELTVNSNPDMNKIPENMPLLLQTGFRCNLDEFYFNIPVMFSVLFAPNAQKISLDNYKSIWTSIQTSQEMCYVIQNVNKKFQSAQNIVNRLESNYASLIHRMESNDQLFFSVTLTNGQISLVSIAYTSSQPETCNLIVKSEVTFLIKPIIHSLMFLLRTDC